MPDLMTCWQTALINGVDIREWAYITDASGLISNGPQKGDIIEQDWLPGAIWQKGPKGTYSFPVPVIMVSREEDVAQGQLHDLQAFVGDQVTLTRRLTRRGVDVAETCQAVMASAVQVSWDFDRRQQLRAALVWQQLSGVWSPA